MYQTYKFLQQVYAKGRIKPSEITMANRIKDIINERYNPEQLTELRRDLSELLEVVMDFKYKDIRTGNLFK